MARIFRGRENKLYKGPAAMEGGASIFEGQTLGLVAVRELKQVPERKGLGNGRWTRGMNPLEGAWAGEEGSEVGSERTRKWRGL